MKNKPKFVFLQMGLEEENSVEDFNSLYLDCVTWESERIYSDDLQFISIDFILARIKELEDSNTHTRNSRTRIDELKNLIK